jgi:hypothetical protein
LSDGCGGLHTDPSLSYSLATDGKSHVLQYENGITDMLVANEVRSKHVEMGTQPDGSALVCLTAPASGTAYALTMPTALGSGGILTADAKGNLKFVPASNFTFDEDTKTLVIKDTPPEP